MSTSPKILVTGAAGFIGSHLVSALAEKGYLVRCFIRQQDNPEFLPSKNTQIVYGDITDKKTLIPVFSGIDVVYHLAARTDFTGETWEKYYRPNVLGTKNLLDIAIKRKIKKFIFFSTIRTVGLTDTKTPVDEKAAYHPLNYYDRSKVEGEKLLNEAYKKFKLPITIIRPTSVYGPRDRGTYFSFFKIIAQGRFFLVGSGENLVSFVYVGNVVDAAVRVLDNKVSVGQTYFITDALPYTMKELSLTIAKAFDKKIPALYLPKNIGYILGFGMEILGKVLKIPFPLSRERVKNLTISYVFSIKKAKKELGYNPKISLKKGVMLTANWYKEKGWI